MFMKVGGEHVNSTLHSLASHQPTTIPQIAR